MNKTLLKDRTLWFDGDSTYAASNLKLLKTDQQVFVDELTADIRQYNNFVPPDKQIRVKTENRPFNFDWIIPDEYKTLDVRDYVCEKLAQIDQCLLTETEFNERVFRVCEELKLYKKHGLEDVLRVLIFVINTLDKQGVVWGVGRGSSVSSYVLYLIGVHDVDSVKYGLDIADFLH